MKRTLVNILKTSRPRFWAYLAGPFVLGAVYSSSTIPELLEIEKIILFLYFLLPANLFLYGVNDYFDRSIDRLNPKKGSKEIRYSGNRLKDLVVVLSGLLGFIIAFPLQILPLMSVFLALSAAYSVPPLRLKTKPLLDSFSNGLYLVPALIGFSISGRFPSLELVAGGLAWTMAMHTFSAIPDIKPDRRAGIRTTATFLGRKKTYVYCGIFWSVSALFFGASDLRLGSLFLIYPILVVLFYLSDMSDSNAYWRYPYINIATGTVLTLYGIWILQ